VRHSVTRCRHQAPVTLKQSVFFLYSFLTVLYQRGSEASYASAGTATVEMPADLSVRPSVTLDGGSVSKRSVISSPMQHSIQNTD